MINPFPISSIIKGKEELKKYSSDPQTYTFSQWLDLSHLYSQCRQDNRPFSILEHHIKTIRLNPSVLCPPDIASLHLDILSSKTPSELLFLIGASIKGNSFLRCHEATFLFWTARGFASKNYIFGSLDRLLINHIRTGAARLSVANRDYEDYQHSSEAEARIREKGIRRAASRARIMSRSLYLAAGAVG